MKPPIIAPPRHNVDLFHGTRWHTFSHKEAIGHLKLVLLGCEASFLSCARPRAPRFSNIAGLCDTLIDQLFAAMERIQYFFFISLYLHIRTDKW